MSLINEALKKAQKQRTHEPLTAMPLSVPAGAPAPRVAKRKEPMPAQTLVVIGALCLALVVALGAGAWFVFKESSAQIAASHTQNKPTAEAHSAKTSEEAATVAAGPSSTAPAHAAATVPIVSSPPPSAITSPTGPASNLATTTASTPVTASAADGTATIAVASTTTPAPPMPSPAAPVAEESVSPSSAGATLPTSAPSPATEVIHITAADLKLGIPPSPQVLAVVDTFKVSGIRASTSDPKVLMNDRVFRLNDIVERTHGLRLREVHADRLLFVDEAGAVYTKTF